MTETTARTATFLFCDTVGSTELLNRVGVEASEEARRRLFAALRDAIDGALGEEVKNLGDGLMVAFPRSTSDAIACAMAMQRGVDRLNLEERITSLAIRIGVAVGEATSAPEERDWFGPAVNLAARLCAAASPGKIVASRAVVDVAGIPTGSYAPLGALALKGFAEPVEAADIEWAVERAAGRVPLPAALDVSEGLPFVGRRDEVAALAREWSAARGGDPRVVVVSGAPGVGKARLVREFVVECFADGATVLYGRCTSGTEAPWSAPLTDALRWYVAATSADALAGDVGEYAAVLASAIPSMRWRLPSLDRTLTEPAGRLHDALVHLVTVSARRAPIVLVVDDAHQARPELTAAILELAAGEAALLVVAIDRSPSGGALISENGGAPLELRGLPPTDVVALVEQLAPGRLATDDTTVHDLTGGVARHVVDAARALAATGPGTGPLDEATLRHLAAQSCPYRGLVSFGEDDHAYWFGRDEALAAVLGRLDRARLVAVVGASGSGKSSLLHAGVAAALRRGALAGSDTWPIATMVPGVEPMRALSAALAALPGVTDAPTDLAAEMRGDVNGFARTASRLVEGTTARFVLVVDQFEEVLRLDPQARDEFVAQMLAAASMPGGPTTVLLAVRADFYGSLTEAAGLGAAIEANHVLIGPMTEADLAAAVTRPAFVAGLRLEDGLAETIVSDVAGQAGGLPLLSHALLETWRRRQGRTLTLAGYRAAGGVRGAIGRSADDVYAALDPASQRAVRELFLRLVQLGEGTEDTRRRVDRRELPHAQEAVVEPLVRARLLTADGATVEVAHEALIREWPQLRRWLDDAREGLRVHRHLTAAAAAWEARGREPTELYGGSRLQAALDWTSAVDPTLNAAESAFLVASARRRRGTARTRRVIAGGLAVLTASALVAAGLAVRSERRATTNATHARAERAEADLRRLLADARVAEGQDLSRALLLAREASLRERSVRTTGALQSALTSNPGVLGFLAGDAVPAWTVDVTADGATLVTGRDDGTVDRWDVTARRRVERLGPFGAGPVAAAIDPFGSTIVIRRSDGTYLSWDVARRAVRDPSFGGVGPLGPVPPLRPLWLEGRGFVLLGQSEIVVAALDGTHQVLAKTDGIIGAVGISPDATTIAALVGHPDGTSSADVLDAVTGVRRARIPLGPGILRPTVAIDRDGRHVSVASNGPNSALLVGDVATATVTGRISGDQENYWPVYVDGVGLLTLSSGGDLARRDPATAALVGPLVRTFVTTADVRPSADGTTIYAAGADGLVAILAPQLDTPLSHSLGAAVGEATISPDGRSVAVLGPDGTLRLVDRDTRAERWRTPTGIDVGLQLVYPSFAWFSPDGASLALGTADDHLDVYDVATGRRRSSIPVPRSHDIASTLKPPGLFDGVLWAWSWTPDGRSVLLARWDSVVLVDVDAGTVRYEVNGFADHVTNATVSADGQLAAGGDYRGTTLVFDASTGAVRSTRHGHWAWYDPGSSTLLLTDYFAHTTTLATAEGEPVLARPVRTIGLEIPTAATPDGTTLVYGGQHRVRLYDRTTGATIGEGFAQPGGFAAGYLTDAGRTLVTSAATGRVTVWNVDRDSWADIACNVAGRNLSQAEWTRYLPAGEPYRTTCPNLPAGG